MNWVVVKIGEFQNDGVSDFFEIIMLRNVNVRFSVHHIFDNEKNIYKWNYEMINFI